LTERTFQKQSETVAVEAEDVAHTASYGETGRDSKRMALIEEVSRRRNLWDNSSALYKDKQRADVEWHRIKETLNGAFNTTFESEYYTVASTQAYWSTYNRLIVSFQLMT
uniref:MADF domain-containing protein n=1 Tax=Heligmosomoides polygyrus TaxID=6339 RepID=A0A183FCP4_HELPZ